MPGLIDSVRADSILGLLLFLVLWIILCQSSHILVMVLRQEPLLGWAIGPMGLTLMVLREPSLLYVWLDVIFPALVSGSVLYIGLFTPLCPVTLHNDTFLRVMILLLGVFLSILGDLIHTVWDLRYPLWGEARVLQTIQFLRATWTKIHFTPFGISYVRTHFHANPTELLQMLWMF